MGVGAFVSIAVCAAGPAGVAHAASTAGNGTTEDIYTPFTTGSLAKGLRISQTLHGSCWNGAEATRRADAWRCASGNFIHDPCFASDAGGTGAYLVCADSPFSRDVIKLVLTKPLPYKYANRDGDPTRFNPWFIRLTSGVVCDELQGATAGVAGMRINYGCSNRGVLIGDPNRSSPTWRIFFAKSINSRSLSRVSVAAAWW